MHMEVLIQNQGNDNFSLSCVAEEVGFVLSPSQDDCYFLKLLRFGASLNSSCSEEDLQLPSILIGFLIWN